jgi:membrane protease YdiL (CAAX protease family)
MRSKMGFWRYLAWPVVGVVAVAVMSGAVMLLWNAVAPALFGDARQIDFLHALGLLVLCRILFGGFRGHGGWHGRKRWNKWQSMTPEEREQFYRRGPWSRQAGDQK